MEELEQHVAELIEQIDNRVGLHSALGYLSPAEFEADRCRQEPCQRGCRRHEACAVMRRFPRWGSLAKASHEVPNGIAAQVSRGSHLLRHTVRAPQQAREWVCRPTR